jgi:hypothetical protein
MKTKQYFFLFLIFFLILLVPTVSAQDAEVKVFKQWTAVDIRHIIEFNGSIDSTTANITVRNPDDLLLVSFQPMQKNVDSNDFNYTVPAGQNGEIGFYNYDICGYSLLAEGTCESFVYQVTPSGDNGLLGYFFLIIILSYGIMVFGIWKEDITISVLGTFALYFLGLWMLFNGIDIFKNFLTDSFAWVTLGVAFYVSARMAHELIEI